jgi:hypothetical protein
MKKCIYCGWNDADSKDHFPPKLFLSRPFPPNLKTVPACEKCNKGYSADEEYYRLIIIGLLCFGESAETIFNGPMARSFDRNASLEAKMFNSLGVDGENPYVQTEEKRIGRVVQKMAIATHFIESGFRPAIQSWFRIEIFHAEPFPARSRIASEPYREAFAPNFKFKFWQRPEDPRFSLVELNHFDEVQWLVTISPKATDQPYDSMQDWANREGRNASDRAPE